jgi:O-antigen/teichoic acid export membrane protein
MMAGMGLLYAVFIALGGNHLLARRFSNPAIVNTLAYLVPLPIVMLPAGLLASVMVVQNRVNKLSIYNVLTSLLMASGIIAACLLWKTPESMVLMRVGISVVIGLFAIGMMFQAVPRDDWRPRWSNMKTMVAFSIPLVLAGALGAMSIQLDKIIVSAMCTPEAFAVYSTGALEIPLVGIITGSISNVLVVDFRKAYAGQDYVEALRLYHLVPIKTSLFLFPLMVYLALAAKPFICVLFSGKYAASTTAFMIYLLMIPSNTILLGGLAAVGKSKIVLRNTAIGLAVNLAFSVILVNLFGYIGAVVGTILALGLWFIPSFLYEIAQSLETTLWQVYPWKAVGRNLILAVTAAVPTAVALWLLRNNAQIVQLLVSSIIYGIAYLAALSFRGQLDVKRDLPALWARIRNRQDGLP